MKDGTARLCELLYGDTRAEHYVGGSEAPMLYDAAREIEALRRCFDIACEEFRRQSSADGSGHADLAEMLERVRRGP